MNDNQTLMSSNVHPLPPKKKTKTVHTEWIRHHGYGNAEESTANTYDILAFEKSISG